MDIGTRTYIKNWIREVRPTLPRPVIMAVDLDGTLCEEGYFPEVGPPNMELILFLEELREDVYIIIWTSRDHRSRDKLKKWLKKHNVPYDSINKPAPFAVVSESPKVYYDVLIDDRAHNWRFGKNQPLLVSDSSFYKLSRTEAVKRGVLPCIFCNKGWVLSELKVCNNECNHYEKYVKKVLLREE